MPNKKEPLSIIIVKTLLAILIFTALGTIIISGGYIISGVYKNKANNKITKQVNQETENYYDLLEKKCAGSSCCLASLKIMRENNYREADEDYNCSDGFKANGLRCITSLSWCEPIEETEWRNCEQDSDCIETQADCCNCNSGGKQIGINKKYLESWENTLAKKCQDIDCIALFNCKEGNVVCENNKCGFKGKADSNSQPDTSDWQTYRNEEFGFEFEYPKLGVNNKEVFIKEKNNWIEICIKIYGDNDFCHSLKYYEKLKEETVEDSIKRQILDKDEQAICTIEKKDSRLENKFKTYHYINCLSDGPNKFSYNHYISDSNYPELFLMYSIGHDTAFNINKWINSISFFKVQ